LPGRSMEARAGARTARRLGCDSDSSAASKADRNCQYNKQYEPSPASRSSENVMEPVILYGIRNCDTVKKARAWLDQRGVEYRFHAYTVSGIEMTRLERWCGELGWEALLNRAGTTFRGLADSQKEGLNPQKAKALMAAHPSLIKRPMLELNGKVIVGLKPELYKSLPW